MSFLQLKSGRSWRTVGLCVVLLAAPGSVAAASPTTTTGAVAVSMPGSVGGSAVLHGRNADSNDYLNPDGSHTVQLFGQPVNYRTGSGGWQPIDNTLAADPAAPGSFLNAANSWHVRFASTAVGITVSTDAGAVMIKPVGGRTVVPRISGATATYRDVWPDTDLVYTVTGAAVKESMLLKTGRAAAAHEFSVSTTSPRTTFATSRFFPTSASLTAAKLTDQPDGSVVVASAWAQQSALLAAPAVIAHGGDTAVNAGAHLTSSGRGTVRLAISSAWLAAQPVSAFPIDLDPGVTVATTTAHSYKSDGYTCTNCGLQFGNTQDGGNVYWRSVGHFNYEQLFGDTVTAASMSISYVAGTRNSYPVNVHHATALSYSGAAAGSVLASGSLSSGKISGAALTSTLAGWVKGRVSGGYFGFTGDEAAGLYTYQKDAITLTITYTKPAVPGAPRSVSATAGNASAKVSFSAPTSNGGAAITSYTATASPGGKTSTGAGSPLTVTGLTNGTRYTFTVRATNSVGAGPASAASNAVIPAPVAGVPGAPTSVSAAAGDAAAKVSFSAPTSNGGAAITSYTATASPGGKTSTGAGSPLTVTGLTNGTAYTFTVRATNSVGAGPASAASNAVTPEAAGGGGIPNNALGFDAASDQSSADISCMKGAGYTYEVLYVNINSDWASTYSALNSNGMQAVLQQGHVNDAFFQDPATGTSTGKDNAAAARSVNYPQGADFFLDVEGTTAGESTLIAWVNNWAAQIKAAGYVPGVYSGAGANLTSSDLAPATLPDVKVYWQSESTSAPDPAQGYVIVQSLSTNGPCGFSIDPDNAKIDLNGNNLHGSG